jgi:hypothetical protein
MPTGWRHADTTVRGNCRTENPLRGWWRGAASGIVSRATCVDGIAKGVTVADREAVFDELAARPACFVPFDASIFFAADPGTVLAVCPARIDGVAKPLAEALLRRSRSADLPVNGLCMISAAEPERQKWA